MSEEIRIVRTPKGSEHPYFMMARGSAQDDRISWEALGVLSYLLSKPDDWRVQVGDLRKRCGRDKVYNILNELILNRYVTREKVVGETGLARIVYEVYETPLPEKPEVDEPLPENPYTENPHTENQELTEYREEQNREITLVAAGAGNAGEPSAQPGKEETAQERRRREMQERKLAEANNPASPLPGNSDNLLDHPMVKYVLDKLGRRSLTKAMSSAFTSPIQVHNPETETKTTYRDLMWHWDNEPGFEAFVRDRVSQIVAMPKRNMDDDAVVKHLGNFGKKPENGKGWPGWLVWKETHPELCTVVEPEENTGPKIVWVLPTES